MSSLTYTASKSRSQQRNAWAISFRHPLRSDARGKPGLKMRRGLGTTDEAEADRMVAQLNEILADPSWWSATRRQEATQRYEKPVVDAFYEEIQAGQEDPLALRDQAIPLPNKDAGYCRVLFVGTTGAGKTSLVRQFIGSDPDEDRFPSTAPAKTTISDTEIVQADGDFEAIVTFRNEFQIQASIEECVSEACMAAIDNASDEKVVERLLNHRDQKFRLTYVLGTWRVEDAGGDGDDWSFDAQDPLELAEGKGDGSLTSRMDVIPAEERAQNHTALEGFLKRIRLLTEAVTSDFSNEHDIQLQTLNPDDRDAALELFDDALYHHVDFTELVHDILAATRARFGHISSGDLAPGRSGWPQAWTFRTGDREEFIRQIRWFSSNYWPEFGRLLTPLVDGIRVRGPLFPTYTTDRPRLVLLDGQGLGHTPDSSSSVTTHITRRFSDVDVIVLVDNAQQPMQAASLAVLRYAASSGHHSKMAIAFSHFDQIRGANLKSSADRKAHVMASVMNALASLRSEVGGPVVTAMESSIEDRCFMLGGVDRVVAKLPARAAEYMRDELGSMAKFFAGSIVQPPPPEACPIYDPTGLAFAVREAVGRFTGPWLARLGLGTHGQIRKQHWTRIKALTRRIAGELDVEYDGLQPLGDLVGRMSEAISRFLDNPVRWTRDPIDATEADIALSQIRQEVSMELHEFCRRRLIDGLLEDWRTANNLGQTGSALRRAQSIRSIYEVAAPLPDAAMTSATSAFVAEVRRLVVKAIEGCGGSVELAPSG